MFDHWRKAAKTDTNIGSNGDGSSLEVPRTADLWESRPAPYPLGNGVKNSNWNAWLKTDDLTTQIDSHSTKNWLDT